VFQSLNSRLGYWNSGGVTPNIFFGPPESAERGLRQHRQEFGRDYRAANLSRLAVDRDVVKIRRPDRQLIERLRRFFHVAEIGRRDISDDDPLCVFVRQRFEQHGVNHAEDGGVRADAERERDHSD
jgi:hypothetical protein